ncbi:hypothetical protein LTR36_006718 [Oleoguttula mirabilis]|uniref:Inositol-pentakisphosphate 2-kinase n=1 Tax=Oleoguttula mirabilis TaxID=1507867 RepID=A0AAV9JBI1_9PEZI|nr:hypothetical protein LTR36_006718 [Oleoguttula mirabilis]
MSVVVYFTEASRLPRLTSIEPRDPSTRCTIEYLDEGGANFVFRLLPERDYSLPDVITRKLLRLRKDLLHVQCTREQLRTFEETFKPLFPAENLIAHELVSLDDGIATQFTRAWRSLDRPAHRARDFLPRDEKYGLLVTDMTPRAGDVLLQIKPKWLAQSPGAPPNARRCRTCALRAQRALVQLRTATDAQQSCPLALVSNIVGDRSRAAQAVSSDAQLVKYLVNDAQPLLHSLRDYQQQLDDGGVLNARAGDMAVVDGLCKAMTLRDCTLFLKRSSDGIEARLGDLDLKLPERLEKWKQAEQSLIDGGWYTNTEIQETRVEERICLLSQ